MAMTLRNKRSTQLNEKVSETQYDILYPETTALQVITDVDHLFVSQTEKDAWSKAAGSAHYKGIWSSTATYVTHDIVKDGDGFFYIAVRGNINIKPLYNNAITTSGSSEIWHNLDYTTFISKRSETIKAIGSTSTADFFLSFVNSNNSSTTTDPYESLYTNVGLKYNPSANTLTVAKVIGNLQGTADKAKVADEATHAIEADHAVSADNAVTADVASNYTNTKDSSGKSNIQSKFEGLDARIDGITDGTGGAVLSNKLYVQLNGETLNTAGFDGSVEQTVNVAITPYDVVELITENKIDEKWLPDSILGNLKYCGTFNELGVVTSGDDKFNGLNLTDISPAQNSNIYFMASYNSTNSGNGYVIAGVADVRVGDWLVSNGTATWAKIDNTDAITMVNSQKGNVETYKGVWVTNTTYYKGDIIRYNNALYIANKNASSGTTFLENNFDIFGKLYTASDAIKIDNNNIIRHNVTLQEGESISTDLVYGQSFVVPSVTTDAFGHVVKLDTNTITMPAATVDTWRPIQLGGTQILSSSPTTNALDFDNSAMITANYANNKLVFNHVVTGDDAGSFNGAVVGPSGSSEISLELGNGFTVPEFDYDAYGHISGVVSKTYRLPTGVVAHKHFNVNTLDGVSTIEAYDASTATATWVANSSNNNKFYLGTTVPTNTSSDMNLNSNFIATKIYQNHNGIRNAVLDQSLQIFGGYKVDGSTAMLGTYNSATNRMDLADSGVSAGVYSAVAVNTKGIVTAGGNIVEFGQTVNADPSSSLAIGGLFFRRIA